MIRTYTREFNILYAVLWRLFRAGGALNYFEFFGFFFRRAFPFNLNYDGRTGT
ncbi:hypothetical protein [Paraburkholderia humisilvae]|uniref:hypothetical protein n=1 Tax=Paraburkholderia humisilvae TaxID=627669 RepID=UPI001583479C|nr:hypothetical protein [Paraburkholderia humisilvae]